MRCGVVLAIAAFGCSGPASMDGAIVDTAPVVPDARICIPSGGSCNEVPLQFAGMWMITGTHIAMVPPGPGLGDITFQLTFTPTSDQGCYNVVPSGVPSTAGANWPDPTGIWRANDFMATFNALKAGANSEIRISWSYCTVGGTKLQVSGSSAFYVDQQPMPTWQTAEVFSGAATKL